MEVDFNTTLYINSTNISQTIFPNETAIPEVGFIYTVGLPLMLIFGTISMAVNVRVLASIRWIRRPISATLYISLSLAAADAFTSLLLCLNLLINSYLPKVWNIKFNDCYNLTIEALRLGGIVTTVLHLMVLAFNHYLGIVRPLHYPIIITHRKTSVCLVVLWIIPQLYIFMYFCWAPDGFLEKECTATFILYLKFRLMFICLLLVPFISMTFIYAHILYIVHRQQRTWQRSAERGASCRHRGGLSLSNTTTTAAPLAAPATSMRRQHHHKIHHHGHHHYHQGAGGGGSGGTEASHRRHHQQIARNVKAVHTTLLILGSFVTGLLPAMLLYVLCCSDCLYDCSGIKPVYFWLINMLVVSKTLANPIIYGARMHEIKEATRRMRATIHRRAEGGGVIKQCLAGCCLAFLLCSASHTSASSTSGGGGGGGAYAASSGVVGRRWLAVGGGGGGENDSQQLYNNGGSWRTGGTRTATCRLGSVRGAHGVSNGNTACHGNGSGEVCNTVL